MTFVAKFQVTGPAQPDESQSHRSRHRNHAQLLSLIAEPSEVNSFHEEGERPDQDAEWSKDRPGVHDEAKEQPDDMRGNGGALVRHTQGLRTGQTSAAIGAELPMKGRT